MGGAISAVFSAVASLFTSPLIAPITLLATQLFKPKMPPPPNPRATPESREAVKKRFGLDTNKYNWFIIGPSGTGKSTLVNTLRGMRAKDAGAAKTGVTETTHKRQAYDMPNYPYAQIHDLPGGGTKAHPQSTYFKEQRIDVADACIIVTRTRFTEFDKYLLDVCTECKVPAFLVRTNFDVDVANHQEDNGLDRPDEAGCMRTIRQDLTRQVGSKYSDRIFVVSGLLRNMGRFEMPALIHAVLHATASSRFNPGNKK